MNERQITFSLTDGNNATDVERRLENVTNDVFYKFRVRAINKFGKSDWSQSSRAMNIEEILKRAKEWRISDSPSSVGAMVGGAVTALALLCILLVLYIFFIGKGGMYPLKKFIANGGSHGTIIGGVGVENVNDPNIELANLSRSPVISNVENPMYDVPTDEELGKLPKVHRAQITLTRFLGSGAFGEVFEGVMKGNPTLFNYLNSDVSPATSPIGAHTTGDRNNLNSISGPPNGLNSESRNHRGHSPANIQSEITDGSKRKVAVKTLRKGASVQAKEDFLKEAKAMANFEHENIVELIGICLDNDPNFLILELMEGGDLLTYLRNCRPSSARQCSALSLGDLVEMCLDVTRGCAYLESIHFVHRDLAARNCLITLGPDDESGRQMSSPRRRVKIGDFGLSRDIYKTDYYRVGGEVDKLLPVKWMSPESLSDGIFTSQSDVWAFGVLLWEIWTLGQQPYSAKTNHEVMVYVKEGNTLDRPSMCPISLHSLMARCWAFDPERRPKFSDCLTQIQELQVYKDELNDICWHNSLSYIGSSGCSDRSSIASQHHLISAPQNTTTTGTLMSSSTGNNHRASQNGFMSPRNGPATIGNELRRGHIDPHGRSRQGTENTCSIDSWKTGGGNGDSGYTNRTTTTVPLHRNSIHSSLASAELQEFSPTFNGSHVNSNHLNHDNLLSGPSYVMPRPPDVHPQLGDIINSHNVLSPSNRNNICR